MDSPPNEKMTQGYEVAPTTTNSDTEQKGKEHGTSDLYLDPKKERKMMLKFDFYAVGLLGLLYMLANLDRSNLGNANIAGMPEDLSLVGNQFGTATTLLFATYVTLEALAAIILKVVGPRYLLTGCAFSWGLCTLSLGFVKNVTGLYICRLFIGLFEASLIPCINVYLGMVYKKSERGKRSSVIFSFSALSSAFGGILAFGLTQIHGPNGFEGWRWLFVVEGVLTLVVVPIFFWFFPTVPTEAWFLTEEEKGMMVTRYAQNPHWGNDEKFSWGAILSVVKDPKFYAFVVFQFSVDISLYAFTTFLPTIVKGLGYKSVQANLMTVPIYFWGLFFFFFTAYMSDRTGYRGFWIAGPLICLIVSLAILISVDSLGVRYFGCFVLVMGIYPTTGMSMMWLNDNVSQHYKRAAMLGMTLSMANTAGVTVGQIFTTQSGPRYIKGLTISLGLAVVALCVVVGLVVSMTIVNKRRAARIQTAIDEGNPLPEQPELGDYDVYFKYSI